MNPSIIAVDDERDFLESLKRGLTTSGFRDITLESDPRKAATLFEQGKTFDIALIDITLPEMDGLELLGMIKRNSPETECIMITALDEARTAVGAIKNGAYDYLVKPVDREDLLLSIHRAMERKRLLTLMSVGKGNHLPELVQTEAFASIITGSASFLKLLKEAELHAQSSVPMLITGESGTGKELLARAIHKASRRFELPFTPINMAALTPTLFDSEFFGYVKGAFTGADKDRTGYLEHTHTGTLFLDEIGVLPMELQAKLLRVLQDGEFIKLGTNNPKNIDVRFIAATNEDLDRLIAQKKFRKDLYFRLKGGWIHLPPLRQRKEDIPLLIDFFLSEYAEERPTGIDEKALSRFLQYDYPGNVRELKTILQAAVNLSQGKPISGNHLPDYLRKEIDTGKHQLPPENEPFLPLSQVEKNHIIKVYLKTGKNKSHAARILGIGLNTLRRKIESYGLD